MSLSKIKNAVKKFHKDEDGMETLQTVMIAGVAAVITIVIIAMWGNIKEWVKGLMDQVQSDAEGQTDY